MKSQAIHSVLPRACVTPLPRGPHCLLLTHESLSSCLSCERERPHSHNFYYSVCVCVCVCIYIYDFIYLFPEREGRERERERNINEWLPVVCPPQGSWPATQACALTGNQSGDPLVLRPVLHPLSHTSQGYSIFLQMFYVIISYYCQSLPVPHL